MVAQLGYKPEQLLSGKDYGDRVVVVINCGIAGCPKFTVLDSDIKIKPAKKAAVEKDAS